MSNKHIVREREVAGGNDNNTDMQGGARGAVVGEIMGDVSRWRRLRDDTFEALWDEYYAKWRGFWMPEHKSYKTERSKLISPLTQMAVDLTSAEIIEAVLGREYFVDLPDDVDDQDTTDMERVRANLVQDLKEVGFIDEFALTTLNGCLYGSGITKIQISTKVVKTPRRAETGELLIDEREEVVIKPVAIEPGQFVPDPGARDIDDMKGCAHEFMMPITRVKELQESGVYWSDFVVNPYRARTLSPNRGDTDQGNRRDQGDVAYITEYYGLVPARMLTEALAEGDSVPVTSFEGNEMVEVIATIANETHLLRIMKNPLKTGERLMVAYQHEAVPGRFFGRGVCEKGANVQRAMDAEMRGRIDALAWGNLPMFAGDLTRMPPNSNMNAWPGKFWGTRGNPNEVLREFKISGPDQNSYAHMQQLESMGQQATGAADSQGLRAGVRDESATGSALAASSFIKRSKRTMFNIEGYMNRLVTRVARLKMQFDAQRYPQDYKFQVKGSVGMMAREIEQQFMVNLMSVIGPDSPASMPIIRAIFEHSGSPVKTEVLQALKAIEEKQPSPEEQAAEAAQLQLPVKQVALLDAQIEKTLGEGELKQAQAEKTDLEGEILDTNKDLERVKVINELEQTDNQGEQVDILRERNKLTDRQLDIQEQQLKEKPKPKS